MTPDDGILRHPSSLSTPYTVTIGNGTSIPASRSGHSLLHTPSGHSFHLTNVLHVPSLVRRLLSVRKFTRDNCCSIEFDPLGFSVKDLRRHRRLGHPGCDATASLQRSSALHQI
uniref:Retrovirus-related Pol polyprotein from transposon TNT 1-94-like beta-barrel domain-containing protein n=1 Tax=Arundo donax TaxID=35708 RepID=A0A0A9DEP4_ARUDO